MYHDIAHSMKQARKKVLFLVTKSNMGGAQRYVFDLATHLDTDIFEPIVAFGNAQGSTGPGALSNKLAQYNIAIRYLPTLTRDVSHSEWRSFKDMLTLLRAERPDVVHLNSSKAGGLGSLAARLAGVRHIIFTAHGWPFRENRNPLSRGLIFLASYLTVLFSHTTICICDYDARAFGKLPFVRHKIKVIRNGIAPESFEVTRADMCAQLHITGHQDDVWVTSIGELNANKHISLALEVFSESIKRNPDLFYVIIGEGEERESLTQQAHALGLREKVHFTGQLADASKYLRAFDVLFLPSQKEGVPYAILEAAVAGVAVLASNVGGIPEVIDDQKSGFIRDPKDVAGFVDALTILTNDTDTRVRFGKTLQATVAQHYSLERMLSETIALYNN